MPEMDGPSVNAAVMLQALIDLDAHLWTIERYLKSRPEVTKVLSEWCLAHNLLPPPGNPTPPIDTWVDAELRNGHWVSCIVALDWGSYGWQLDYSVRVNRSGEPESLTEFPIVETSSLEEIVASLRHAGAALVEAVQVLDLRNI